MQSSTFDITLVSQEVSNCHYLKEVNEQHGRSHKCRERGGHRNLFFITPHKAQIDISQVTQDKANQRGVSILSFLAEQDLNFVGWVTKRRNEDLYLGWARALACDYYRETISELSHAISGLKATETEEARYQRVRDALDTLLEALEEGMGAQPN